MSSVLYANDHSKIKFYLSLKSFRCCLVVALYWKYEGLQLVEGVVNLDYVVAIKMQASSLILDLIAVS